jgi:hypothetical protein
VWIRVQEGGESGVVDEDSDLHGAARTRLDPSYRMDGYGGVISCGRGWMLVVVIDHLNGEQVLAHLLVPLLEEIIAMEALPILTLVSDLHER